MKIRYIGSGTNPASYQEYPVTGVNALWQPEQVSDVSDARANALVATGGFVYDDDGSVWSAQRTSHAAEHVALGISARAGKNTLYLAGDSMAGNGLVSTGSPVNFLNRSSEGWFTWLDASLGAPFYMVGCLAAGGKTTSDMMSEQIPTIVSSGVGYCAFSIGINDINVSLASGETTAANIILIVQKLMVSGITPIWGTLFPMTYDSVVTPKIIKCNDILRRFAQQNPCGLFFDAFSFLVDPSNSQNNSRGASYNYDSPAYLHPNNAGALLLGRWAASKLGNGILKTDAVQCGNEDVTYATTSNLLSNPAFTGVGGTVSANCTGTMPTGWVIDWATRTGTASAAAAVVNVTDSVTGLAIGRAIQITISGSAAANDVIRVYQSDTQNATLRTSLSGGNEVQAEGVFTVATGANISQIAMRVQTNTNETTWFGVNGQTAVSLPATIPAMTMRTAPLTVLGSTVATQARYDFRVTFNGVGTGSVITLYSPRVRKVS